jgi:predicted MFS family arabinose efflux permease
LDRSNIGNAKVAGLAADLSLDGYKYNICAAVFFLTYSAAEIPSNILLKLFRPSIWIPSIMLAWGIVMTLMCLVKSYEGLIAARVFLGLTESGLFPGVTYYISMWYRRSEQARRVGIFFSAATVAGAFGGILAFGIQHMEGVGGLHGWAWIFCLEGLLTVIVAFIAYFTMYDYPENSSFLTEAERQFVVQRLKEDSAGMATHYDIKFVWQALTDWKTFMQVAIYIGILIPVYAFSLFLPTIIAGLGAYTAAQSQLLTIPPYVTGCIFTIGVGILSDKYNIRGVLILASTVVGIVGYAVLYGTTSPGAGYAGTMIAAVGVFPSIPVALAWAGGNAGGDMKRGVVIAAVIGIGNLGGICSSFIYRSVDTPRFHIGHGTVIGCLLLSFVGTCIAMFTYSRLNKQKEELCAREGITEAQTAEFAEMGSDSPLFRYVI